MPEPTLRALQEQQVAALEVLAERRKDDPLLTWTPHDKQRAFIEAVLRGPHFENWLVTANRFGKSTAGAYCGAYLARFGVDQVQGAYSSGGKVVVYDRATSGWVTSVTDPASRDTIQPYYFDNGFGARGVAHAPFIPQREIQKWNSQDQVLKLKNGSIIGFKSSTAGVEKFKGAGKDWVHEDEEQPFSIHEESTIRVMGGRRLRFFGTCTILPPENGQGGVTWVYSKILVPWMGGQSPNIGCFGGSIYDNPHVLPEVIAELEARWPPTSTIGRIRLGGEWLPGLSGARAYPSFSRALHAKPQAPLNPRLPLCWAFDFNVSPMVSLIGQREGRVFRVLRELVMEEGNVLEMCEWFREVVPRHSAEVWVFGDSTGRGRDAGVGKSDYQLIQNAMRTYPAPVRIKVPEVNPNISDRINAVQRLLRDERGEVRLEIDSKCVELIADMEQVLRDVRGKIQKTSDRRNPYYERTHTSDALGYWLSYEEPVRSTSSMERRPVAVTTPRYAWSR